MRLQADVMNCNKALFSSVPPQLPQPTTPTGVTSLPCLFDKQPRSRRPLSATSKVSQISQPLLISRQAQIFVPHFISFAFVSFPPSAPLSSSRRCRLLCFPLGPEPRPRSTVRAAALGGLEQKRLFPLHFTQGLEIRRARPPTDGVPLRGQRVVLLAGQRRNLFKVCCYVLFAHTHSTHPPPPPPPQSCIPAQLISGSMMNDECAGKSDDDPPAAVIAGASSPPGATRGGGVAAIFRLGSIIRV